MLLYLAAGFSSAAHFFVYRQIGFPIEVQQVLARFRQGLLQPTDRGLQVGPLRFQALTHAPYNLWFRSPYPNKRDFLDSAN